MARRVLLSALLIPALALVVWTDFARALPFFAFILALSAAASRELYLLVGRIMGEEDARRLRIGFLIPGPLFLCVSYVAMVAETGAAPLLAAAGALALFMALLPPAAERIALGGLGAKRSAPERFLRPLGRSLLLFSVFLYSGTLPLAILFLRRRADGAALVSILFGLAWFSDASAYFIGTFFGRTRGIVRASPNKSVEGYAGAFALTIGISAVLPFLFPGRYPLRFAGALGAGILIAVLAPLGDLGESALKRRAGVKDSSKMLPAFGGALDIFDSVLSCAPFYLFLCSVVT